MIKDDQDGIQEAAPEEEMNDSGVQEREIQGLTQMQLQQEPSQMFEEVNGQMEIQMDEEMEEQEQLLDQQRLNQ